MLRPFAGGPGEGNGLIVLPDDIRRDESVQGTTKRVVL